MHQTADSQNTWGKTYRAGKRNRWIHNYSWECQCPLSVTDRTIRKQGYKSSVQNTHLTGSNGYVENIPPNHSRKHSVPMDHSSRQTISKSSTHLK